MSANFSAVTAQDACPRKFTPPPSSIYSTLTNFNLPKLPALMYVSSSIEPDLPRKKKKKPERRI